MKITNPYNKLNEHLCFGCSHKNPIGLNLSFELDGESIIAFWKPDERYQGFHQVLHGGIQATLLDEVAGWVVQVICKTSGVTSELSVKYHKPVYTNEKELRLEAKILLYRSKVVDVEAKLFNSEGVVCTSALISYYLFSEQIAKEKFYYPGSEAFFP